MEGKPRVVGVIFGLNPYDLGSHFNRLTTKGARKFQKDLQSEYVRIGGFLHSLPRGSRVGMEIGPKTLQQWRRTYAMTVAGLGRERFQQTFYKIAAIQKLHKMVTPLGYAIMLSLNLGHQLVPLESESAVRRHMSASQKAIDVTTKALKGEPLNAREAEKLKQAIHETMPLQELRVSIIGKKIIRSEVPVSIVSEPIALQLETALAKTHQVELPPETKFSEEESRSAERVVKRLERYQKRYGKAERIEGRPRPEI